MVEAVNEIARAESGRQVATVGKLEVRPNAPNVIPGLVRHTVDIRDLSPENVEKLGTVNRQARESDRFEQPDGTKYSPILNPHQSKII
ncbi:hypothetical protein [Parasphingorhabdus sp.]|uniref:hypothetical protein n=1 Tax=Parasphingorhabdus sp. TaxID=2709688 RepID=UPI003002A058